MVLVNIIKVIDVGHFHLSDLLPFTARGYLYKPALGSCKYPEYKAFLLKSSLKHSKNIKLNIGFILVHATNTTNKFIYRTELLL